MVCIFCTLLLVSLKWLETSVKFSRWILNLVKKSFLAYSLDLIPFLPHLGN